MRILITALAVGLWAASAPAQSLFIDTGGAGSLLGGGYVRADETDGAFAYYGVSIKGEADLALQVNRVSMPDGRTSWSVQPGVRLFLLDLGQVPGTLQVSLSVAAEFGDIEGGTFRDPYSPGGQVTLPDTSFRGLVGTARAYGRFTPEHDAFLYFGISYVDLELKTDHGDWTNTLSGSSQPVHLGVTGASGALVGDVRIDHADGETSYTISMGLLL